MKSWFWNAGESRLRAGWRLLAFVAAIAAMLAAVSGGAHLLALALGTRLDPSALLLPVLAGLLTGLVSLVALWLVARNVDRRSLAEFGFAGDRAWWWRLAIGMAVGFAMMAAIFILEAGLGLIRITELAGPASLAGELLLAFVSYCGAALFEEVATRAYPIRILIEGLASWLGTRRAAWVAIILPGLIFGALHYPNPGSTLISTLAVAFAGIVGGAIYVLSGQIAIPLGVHLAWNFAQGSVFGFAVSGTHMFEHSVITIDQGGPDWLTGGAFGPEAGAIGVGVWALTAGIFGWRHRAKFASLGEGFVAPPPAKARRTSAPD